jgi:hypothetical protein
LPGGRVRHSALVSTSLTAAKLATTHQPLTSSRNTGCSRPAARNKGTDSDAAAPREHAPVRPRGSVVSSCPVSFDQPVSQPSRASYEACDGIVEVKMHCGQDLSSRNEEYFNRHRSIVPGAGHRRVTRAGTTPHCGFTAPGLHDRREISHGQAES